MAAKAVLTLDRWQLKLYWFLSSWQYARLMQAISLLLCGLIAFESPSTGEHVRSDTTEHRRVLTIETACVAIHVLHVVLMVLHRDLQIKYGCR